MREETEHTCQFCYYEYFDGRAYPCSMCVCGEERKDMFMPKGRQNKRKTEAKTCDSCKLKGTTKWCDNQVVCRAYEPKDEPQYDAEEVAKDINRRAEMTKKEWNARRIEDEPQTDCPWK